MGKTGPKLPDLVGKKIGRLTVLRLGSPLKSGLAQWACMCECGKETFVQTFLLVHNHRQSCGCLAIERITTHGMSGTSTHRIWRAMKHRCQSPKAINYQTYGGKGVSVCERWAKFENFLADMGPRPSPRHTLDRYPNCAGNYELGNVRWATWEEQGNNKRTTKLFEYNGDRMTIAMFARKYGISGSRVYYRINRGWSLARALTTPVMTNKSRAKVQ